MRNCRTFRMRSRNGYALVSIIVIGSFAMMFLLGLATTFLAVLRSETVYHQKDMLLDAVDSSLDYTIDMLNRTPPTNNNDSVHLDIPSANFPSVNPPITVKVRVTPLERGGGINWTNVNEFSILQSFPASTIPLPNGVSQTSKSEYWRLVEITATRGLFQKNVRVILEPQVQPPSGGPLPPSSAMGGTVTTALFPQAVFANSKLTLGNDLNISPKNGMSDLIVQSNTDAILNEGAKLDGSLSAQKVTGATLPNNAPNVSGDLNTNEVVGEISHPNSPAPFDGPSSVSPSPVNSFSNPLQLPLNGGTDLASASYSASALQINGSSTITLPSAASSPTKIYIDSAASSADINTSGITYGDGNTANPMNFQIYYDGNGPVTITTTAANPFQGTIYAPRSKVIVNGNGDFKGAILGDEVEFNNRSVEVITDINNSNTASPSGQTNFSYGFVYRVDGQNRMFFQGYKPVTWQEVNEKLVP